MDEARARRIVERRFEFLRLLYDVVQGNVGYSVMASEFADANGFEEEEATAIIKWGWHHQLIAGIDMISLTNKGVEEVIHAALPEPESPTANVIIMPHATNTQIQQGVRHSTQTGTFSSEFDAEGVGTLFREIHAAIPELPLTDEQRQDLTADVDTVQAQLRSTKPKVAIVREAGHSVRNILEGATGSILASSLVHKLVALGQLFG